MHPAIKTLLLCILIGATFGTYLYFTYDHRFIRIAVNVLSSVNIGSLMMLLIYYRGYFINRFTNAALKVIVMILLLILVALTGTELTLIMRAGIMGEAFVPFSAGSIYILNILVVMVIAIPIYISEEWKSMANARMLQQQYRLLQLEQQQTAFELELLRAKINPHFLYNMHNTIAGLISQDPAKAEELVLLLSKFFRFTLNKDSVTCHPVKDELDIISTYLHMQQIRYGNRMRYTIHAAPDTLHMQMPSFILQPLVENAVKHGIETMAADGNIDVQLSLKDTHLVICIADSGPAFPDIPGTGMGLQMVMNKLKLLYGDNYTIELNNTPEKYVRIIIPGNSDNVARG
ncbi:sensor histidine kinase [Chitinophaga pinensis]|uniref:Signal transduction histidine kinase, LytS n=1 Tax=Chitinophaga pinensis (strain ATCC 43595 / DSM 2588 / LMG 13176 / NBRC 15968 / NCIMB 11800 / UQM 2034) TaxID=485918 RepID=A0A979GYI7_CHIPD|nr:histidine kinase [Chitinophaga pinensis]ACU63156.1 signal transduction histidine kinase, LytS [Chitinophaga pinensis DSM 2588]